MQSVGDQRNRFKGRPAVILGAGPSLPGQIKYIPDNAVKIAINERPPLLVECDYVVFYDFNTIPLVGDFKCKKISPFNGWSEFWIDSDVWFNGWSGSAAVWFACYAGCDPVILMGMDCYQGEKEYFTDEKPGPFQSSGGTVPLEKHMKSWGEAFVKCPNPGAIKAFDGPLVEIFGKWEPLSKSQNSEKDLIKKRMTR